jgi:hypothetical protein
LVKVQRIFIEKRVLNCDLNAKTELIEMGKIVKCKDPVEAGSFRKWIKYSVATMEVVIGRFMQEDSSE